MFIAALIGLKPSIPEMLVFSALGFGVVMFVLAVLSVLTSIAGIFFTSVSKPKDASAKAAASADAKKGVSKEENPDHAFVVSAAVAAVMPELQAENAELVAVLSAAASAALDDECRVLSFKSLPDMSYARQGRAQIYASKIYVPSRVK